MKSVIYGVNPKHLAIIAAVGVGIGVSPVTHAAPAKTRAECVANKTTELSQRQKNNCTEIGHSCKPVTENQIKAIKSACSSYPEVAVIDITVDGKSMTGDNTTGSSCINCVRR